MLSCLGGNVSSRVASCPFLGFVLNSVVVKLEFAGSATPFFSSSRYLSGEANFADCQLF